MRMKAVHDKVVELFQRAEDIPLLFLRIILAYTFYGPAMSKFSNIEATADYFAYLGIPLPLLNTYLAAGTELAGAVLLLFGLFTRFVSIPLLFVLGVAVATVHGVNGFHLISPGSGWEDPYINGEMVNGTVVLLQNGYELIVYYSAMLLVLMTKGAGRLSLDHVFFKERDN